MAGAAYGWRGIDRLAVPGAGQECPVDFTLPRSSRVPGVRGGVSGWRPRFRGPGWPGGQAGRARLAVVLDAVLLIRALCSPARSGTAPAIGGMGPCSGPGDALAAWSALGRVPAC